MISIDAIKTILGIKENVDLSIPDMIKTISISFYPNKDQASDNVLRFSKEFNDSLVRLGIKIIPYSSVWEVVHMKKRLKRLIKYSINNFLWIINKILNKSTERFFIPIGNIIKLCSGYRIKDGVTVVCVGKQDEEKLVMQYIRNFKTNSIITIVDLPDHITNDSDFHTHFDTSMNMFSYHMTNILIGVGTSNWITYNFNASHPSFKFPDNQLDKHILESIIPKIAAPISPHKLSEFNILKDRFDPEDKANSRAISDMYNGSLLFSKTGLFPDGKKINDLPFRNNFHKFIGKLHLDNRNGMSFGFLAYQLPPTLHKVLDLNNFTLLHPEAFQNSDVFIDKLQNGIIYLLLKIKEKKLVLRVPEVWVMTLRSGSQKTGFNIKRDLLKIGLINGKMLIQFPKHLMYDHSYKPSFDTKVILANAVSNSLIATLASHLNIHTKFTKQILHNGISISHWHGYFNKNMISNNFIIYGENNPHVSCSSPQSAIYAMKGKIENILMRLTMIKNYVGDIHIEPHHGVNVTYPSITELARYILENPGITKLGNKFL